MLHDRLIFDICACQFLSMQTRVGFKKNIINIMIRAGKQLPVYLIQFLIERKSMERSGVGDEGNE